MARQKTEATHEQTNHPAEISESQLAEVAGGHRFLEGGEDIDTVQMSPGGAGSKLMPYLEQQN